MKIKQEIRFDKDRNRSFPTEISKLPGGENLSKCIQCGTCSGTCPLSIYMDHTPRQIINLTRAGFKKDVLESNTIWLCASCYSCTVECPKEVGITDIMYSLKQQALKEGSHPKKFPIPILAEKFYGMVKKNGRVNESMLATSLFLKTDPTKIFGMRNLGLKMMKTGRFSLKTEKMDRVEELQKVLEISKRKKETAQ